jgi:hypothetical protein
MFSQVLPNAPKMRPRAVQRRDRRLLRDHDAVLYAGSDIPWKKTMSAVFF